MERVDILLATYNGEKYLREQLDSILKQSYKEFRLLISDDCSTDSTRKILKEYKAKDSRIHLYFQEKNLGVVRNFEFLLRKVESKYYMFSDQDDIWKKDKIKKSVKKIEEEDAALVYTDLEVVDENLNVIYESYWKLKGFYNKIKKYNNFESLYLNNFITGCTILSRSEYIKDVLPLPKSSKYVLHDCWIPLILSQDKKLAYIEEPQIMYRQHKNNKIGSRKRSDELETIEDIRHLFIRVKEERFEAFIKHDKKFQSEKVRELNKKALRYYEILDAKQYANFVGWPIFFKLYKYEEFKYNLENFLILNLPCVAKILFKLKGKK